MLIRTLLAVMLFTIFGCKKEVAPTTYSETLEKSIAPEKKSEKKAAETLSKEFKDYWYSGTADVTSYELEQARYGESRKGNAVLVFVTEPFHSEKQVKADHRHPDNISVMKLNTTKKFTTGVYPYSIMTSTFYPVSNNQHALKITNSVQEWCGQVFSQLNNKEQFEVQSFSYFESESDQKFNLDKALLENELLTQLRINPENLPEGELEIIPDFSYLRLRHKELKTYKANVSNLPGNNYNVYTITYPELKRTLTIQYLAGFPYNIESITETYSSGFGKRAQEMSTTLKKKKTLNIPYWNKNKNVDQKLRTELGLSND
ncbi:MAG: septum formation inhibitor Maf [Flavobacteriaceae bacterium]|nr:septum formation inhibitor Maf [Flavobacteriaceae bacterium]